MLETHANDLISQDIEPSVCGFKCKLFLDVFFFSLILFMNVFGIHQHVIETWIVVALRLSLLFKV